MATDDDAAVKAPTLQSVPSPSPEAKEAKEAKDAKEATEPPPARPRAATAPERSDSDRINERLTERIRQGTTPPSDSRDRERERDRDRDVREDKLNETIRQRLEHLVPELVKKTFAAGMGAVFSTEEGIRKIAREVSLPDVVGYVASSADGAKDKVFEVVARETRDFLANLNLTEEIAKILTTLSFEIKTEIRFIPNSERMTGAEPDVKASVKLKRNDKAMGSEEEGGSSRDSRSRLRFWRRDDEQGDGRNPDDENDGHDK